MELTVALIVTVFTLIAGEVTKITPIPNKYIPLQNIIIAALASVVCVIFKIENMGVLETIITCVFATMSAGGLVDLKKVGKQD